MNEYHRLYKDEYTTQKTKERHMSHRTKPEVFGGFSSCTCSVICAVVQEWPLLQQE